MRISNLLRAQGRPPWKVVFFGTDEFSLRVLQALNENRLSAAPGNNVVEKVVVVNPPSKKLTPVKKYSRQSDLVQVDWPLKYDLDGFDVGVLASFGHLVPRRIIRMFPHGILNVHPSLLPKWRGAAPLRHTILNGESKTGVTIMALKPKHFDVGPLVSQKEFDVPVKCHTQELQEILSHEGSKMMMDALSKIPDILTEAPIQSDESATYAHKVTQPMSFIDWENQTVDEIDRQYRAFHDMMELRSNWEGTTVRLLDMMDINTDPSFELDNTSAPGKPVFCKKDKIVWIRCKDGWVGFQSVLIKKKMSAQAFQNGYLSKDHLKHVTFKSIRNGLFDDTYQYWVRQRRPM